MTAITTSDPDVVEAVLDQRLASWAANADHDAAASARVTTERIGAQVADELAEIVRWLSARGHDVEVAADARPRQRHDVEVRLATHADAAAAATSLAELGFERWDRWSGGAARSFRRHGDHLTVVRTDEQSLALRLRWRDRPGGGRVRRLLRSLFRPTHGDWTMVRLPTPLAPAYSLVRPLRLVLERTRLRDRHAAGLGPFLATPQSLIAPLLDLADVGADDVVLDVGCGDGRIVVEAARTRGCRAIGAEHDPELARRAQHAAEAAGVAERVRIELGDARDVDLSEVTVALMFLPTDVAAEILPDTVRRLPTGARLLVHEQRRLPDSIQPPPSSTAAVIADDAVTVARLWTV